MFQKTMVISLENVHAALDQIIKRSHFLFLF